MRIYYYLIILGIILCVTDLSVNAQNNQTVVRTPNAKHLKSNTTQSDISNSLVLPFNKVKEQAVNYIEGRKNKYDDVSDRTIAKAVNADDSAYVYLWDTDWSLKYRIYYIFNSFSIEILQEKINPDGSWTAYSQRILEYYVTGEFKSETESYWKNSVSMWEIAYYEEYNTSGRRTEVFSKNWNDTTQQFTEGYRIVSGFKKDTLLESELYQEWDVNTKGWMNMVSIAQSFNANDLISNTTQSIWKEGDWENDYSIDFEFDAFGNLVKEESQDWDTVGAKWINDVQIVRQFNSLGNITNVLRKEWDTGGSSWVNDVNRTISYNTFFQVVSNLIQTWSGSSWIDSLRATYAYTPEGDISQYLEEIWSDSKWNNLYREVYSYDSKEITININNWDADVSEWENDVLIINYLNDQGYIMIEQYDFWNSISSIYETGYYDEYEEDGTNPEYYEKYWNDSLNKFTGGVRVLSSYYENVYRDLKQRIIQVWDTIASEWENTQKTEYFWSALVAVEEVSLDVSYKIYPSPFNSIIHIEATNDAESPFTLKIYDLNGRVVNESELTGRITTIDVSHLNIGVYLAEIQSGKEKSVMRIIKK